MPQQSTLKQVYYDKVKELGLKPDSLQLEAIERLQNINNQLVEKKPLKFNLFGKKLYPEIQGLYMWGGVGRGKTFIMDMFYEQVPVTNKTRQHFSHFMKDIHSRLRGFQGKKNPIGRVANQIAKETRIICFDEFFVEDIADAMILGNIFKELFALGVVLVATSNIEPQKLYSRGLQRELFLPAIEVLKQNVSVLNLDSGVDYRFLVDSEHLNYTFPYNEHNRKNFFDRFFVHNKDFDKGKSINVLDREIPTLLLSHTDVCFEFSIICGDGRSAYDYIEICKRFEQIFLYNLVGFDEYNEDMARRFIAFIDECYDQNKKVIILANQDFKNIYNGEKLKFEFQRTISRLNDMQNSNFGSING
ncbi:cell division protein ZapE [Francisella adeliensis]|uniref:AFG1 family ATPase n=1 Tax=Francisella adeliensis TaxID=2007306 RepID=A0A2Z4Y072_9GAMM|nr:cell division protein ZapE [Francisella adeliensis]AXA34547.1 cell division protein ZapE [Francisella adeliensis]MBK2086271.1 cell division protein ZapE [Francisella adeliensis]MBK2096488.1 cell division protein ZapE [Francisella adeliensis]QIW12794.1 AFG1 family ATPase [Francisella adeliensis]QIW14672.1 AFG1 family ATPase [Francisella adeliensis]